GQRLDGEGQLAGGAEEVAGDVGAGAADGLEDDADGAELALGAAPDAVQVRGRCLLVAVVHRRHRGCSCCSSAVNVTSSLPSSSAARVTWQRRSAAGRSTDRVWESTLTYSSSPRCSTSRRPRSTPGSARPSTQPSAVRSNDIGDPAWRISCGLASP